MSLSEDLRRELACGAYPDRIARLDALEIDVHELLEGIGIFVGEDDGVIG